MSTQAELVRRLAAEQIYVTQGTVSRDLKAIGAVRRHGADGSVRYRLETGASPNGADSGLTRAFDEYVVSPDRAFLDRFRRQGCFALVRLVGNLVGDVAVFPAEDDVGRPVSEEIGFQAQFT